MTAVSLRVIRLGAGGDGVARHPEDDRVVFVPGGLPGDLWRGQVDRGAGGALHLFGGERLQDGQQRRPATCAARPRCGGCDWHELLPSAALEAKRMIVIEAFRRIAGAAPEIPCTIEAPHGAAAGGRHRVALRVIDGALCYSERRSNRSVRLDRCAALAPGLEAAMVALNGAIAGLPAGLSEVHASLSGDGNTVATRLIVRRETTDEGVRRLCQAMLRVPGIDGAWTDKAGRSVEAGQVHLAGLIATGASKKFRVRGGNFHQSSPPVNAAMVAAARAEVGAGRGDLVVDLHGGAGNFGLAIAPSGADVSIAEIDPWAYEDLARNTAVFRGRGKVRAAALPGDQLLLRIAKRGAVRAVVFDPPRIGDPASARRIAEVLPQTVVAFGCDPATSARDFATMGMGGVYRLTRLSLWDAFPGTHHSEILAVLERGS